MTERSEMEAAIEAVLFVAGEPVSRERLLGLFPGGERDEAAAALDAVLGRFGGDGRGVMVDEAAGGVRLVTRPELHDWLRRFFESGAGTKLSMAALETLAIVAYRQPVTAPEIQELRGVNPTGVLKTLLERRLVRISGRKEVVGKPFLYATTREFLLHFGLGTLKDLPPLEELEEVLGGDGGGAGLSGAAGPDRDEEFYRAAAALEEMEAEAEAGVEAAGGAGGEAS
ncbi:MAG TPA: SMC-Scp complex subunit ScpB [Thermoanaerobaculia bacterium]|nr:SMC-Scp complex subunit ScpB [Thermoanaerobaculia bacterium]